MTDITVQQIKKDPAHQELARKRRGFAWLLSIIMLVLYYAFIMVIAFKSSLLGAQMGTGVMTVGIPVGISIIVIAFILTGIYVRRANGEFDALSRRIKENVGEGQ